ncbi:porin [Arcicella aquatica]|uniref:Porin n=1 Tax=Arcicella aquatica TaxID=217141 RepID=A0ABU5QJB0_9BACT|nr:porin [Arcicella aquatica]MEA5257157.1 porin [Arcicella aquatica]
MKKTLITLFSLFLAVPAFSQEKEEDKGKFTFSGYIDSYYLANFNNPKDMSNTGASKTARAFDQKTGFSLGLVQTKIGYATAKSDVVVDLAFGPNADLGNYGNNIGPLGAGSSSLVIKQAYFNWKATDKFTLTAGQFGTHIGYEVIDAPVNYHYSLSNLFNNGPFYHVGVKAAYAVSDKFALMGGIVNGVDQLYSNNEKPGLIAQVFVQPVAGWNVYVNGITANRNAKDATTGTTSSGSYNLLDLTTTYQVTEKFLLGLNAATGKQNYATGDGKTWGGFAVYPKYDFSSTFSLGARYESFSNTNGVTALLDYDGNGVTVNSFTVTPTFTVADGHLLLKPEFRVDSYDKNFFTDGDGVKTKSQSTFTWAMIYKF